MGRKKGQGEEDLYAASASAGELKAPRSSGDLAAVLWVPRGCLQKEWAKPAFQVPFFQLQKAEKGPGERGGLQT